MKMRKIYFMMLLMAALLCVPTGVKAETQVVLSEDFESNSLETNGWTKQSCHSKTGIETTASHSTSRSFKFNYSTNPPQYLISKELSVPAGATALNVSFYYKVQMASYTESFQVGYSTTDNDVANFTWDAQIDATNTTWEQYTNATFPVAAKYIAIRYNSNDQYYLFVDDIEITAEVAVSCEKPGALTQGEVTGTTAAFSWTKGGTEETWQYICLPEGTEVDWADAAVQTATTTSATVTGLNPVSNYVFYLRAKCSDDDQSTAVSAAFKTACAAIANSQLPWTEDFNSTATGSLPACWDVENANVSGKTTIDVSAGDYWTTLSSNALRMNGIASNGYGYALLPPFEAALNTLQIAFSHRAESATFSGKAELGYFKGGEFILLKAYDQNSGSMKAEEAYPLNELPADAERIAFRYQAVSSYTYAVFIDDITVELIPDCAKPKDVTATATPDGAVVTWEQGKDETAYLYACVATGETPASWTAVEGTERSLTLTGLNAGTYDIYVRPDCSETAYAFATFTPACAAPATIAATALEAHTATLAWDAVAGISWYQYTCVAKDAEPDWTAVEPKEGLTAELTGLTAATAYDFYVRSWFSESVQSEAAKFSFTTDCDTFVLPFEENFEGGQLNCWTTGTWSESSAAGAWSIDNNYSHSGFSALRFNARTNGTGVISSPEIVLSKKAELSFFLRNVYGANAGYVEGKVIAADVENGENKVEAEFIHAHAENLTEQKLDLSALEGKTVKITFLADGVGTSTTASLYIDDVKVTEITEEPVATGMDNTSAAEQVIKTVENGQIVIILNGVKYNAQGQKL